MSPVASRIRVAQSRAAGILHVRSGPLALAVLVIALLFTGAFPELSIPVSVVFDQPPRGVGTPEIVALALASILPALTVPSFDGRELMAGRSARLGNLAYSAATLTAPLLVLPTWYWRIQAVHPDVSFPPLHGLIGNVFVFSCAGAILCLTLGPLLSAAATPTLFAGFVVVQQAAPHSFLAVEFATGLSWYTNYWITTALVLLTLGLTWHMRAVPWTNRG